MFLSIDSGAVGCVVSRITIFSPMSVEISHGHAMRVVRSWWPWASWLYSLDFVIRGEAYSRV
jgi:hypothetical protein